jgi:sugar lactone lactonase YvrE
MTQTVQENKEILKSNKMLDVNSYKSKLTKFRAIPKVPDLMSPSLRTNTVQGRELSIELGDYRTTLTQTTLSLPSLADEAICLSVEELLKEAKVIANIKPNIKHLQKVACFGPDRAWLNGADKTIRCVDINGTVTDTVITTCSGFPADITVNRQGELIYSDRPNRTVNMVRHGKRETLITTPPGWHPEGLCCTRSGDILVGMSTADNNHYKIVRYQRQGAIQEIDRDEHGNPIYRGGSYIVYLAENSNGDIVASDGNAQALVVVNRAGKVRFRYNDKPPGGKKSFSPEQIVTDSMGHIIVADYNNACLHILDQDGKFVNICGLNDRPKGLSVDSEGRLWVGLYKSGEVKVIQYVK